VLRMTSSAILEQLRRHARARCALPTELPPQACGGADEAPRPCDAIESGHPRLGGGVRGEVRVGVEIGEPGRSCRLSRSVVWIGPSANSPMWRTTKSEPGASRARVVFLTVVSAGLRRGEILGLRWKDVALADPAGATLRVRETFVRGHVDTPKSEKSERTLALGKRLASELFDHRARTGFIGDDEHVFVSQTGGPLDPGRYAATLRLALAKAKVDRPMRPFHDGRHTSITNAAAAGTELGGAAGARRTRLVLDDPGVHRPGRRSVPRRGRPPRGSALRGRRFG
jgi:hypothetical protein